MALTILCLSFFGLLVLGVPVAFAIGLSSICTIVYEGLPMGVLLSPPYIFIIPLLNAVWGLFAWAFIKAADMALGRQESMVRSQ